MLDANDNLTLKVAGQLITFWEGVSVTCSLEQCPNTFDIVITDATNDGYSALNIKPMDACEVFLGGTKVITGYVDRYDPVVGPERHTATISGRGKCQDLVDCSIMALRDEYKNVNAVDVAKKLTEKFDINVVVNGEPNEFKAPQYIINLGEKVFQVIERICRFNALLCYENFDGDLVLGTVGNQSMASGVAAPGNVQDASVNNQSDQRFSEYTVIANTIAAWTLTADQMGETNLQQDSIVRAHAKDEGVTRYRPLIIVTEENQAGTQMGTYAKLRAEWEAARRMGRSRAVRCKVDSWRDAAGTLWTINNLCQVDIPILKVNNQNWVIAEVTFTKNNESGTNADLLLMPPDALKPMPVVINNEKADVNQFVGKSNQNANPTSSSNSSFSGSGLRDKG